MGTTSNISSRKGAGTTECCGQASPGRAGRAPATLSVYQYHASGLHGTRGIDSSGFPTKEYEKPLRVPTPTGRDRMGVEAR